MSRRWKIALPISGSCAVAMAVLFLSPAAAVRPVALQLQDSIISSRTPAPALSPDRLQHPHPAMVAMAQTSYVVQSGDSLSLIAQHVYGSAADWTVIYWRNKGQIADVNSIMAGQRLVIPPLPARIPAPPASAPPPATTSGGTPPPPSGGGIYSFSQLEALWVSAGGPSWAQSQAATVAECESGGNASAYNPSGASGLWQILGQVVPGNIFDPYINAANAVAKFKASGWAPWVCQP